MLRFRFRCSAVASLSGTTLRCPLLVVWGATIVGPCPGYLRSRTRYRAIQKTPVLLETLLGGVLKDRKSCTTALKTRDSLDVALGRLRCTPGRPPIFPKNPSPSSSPSSANP